MRKVNSSHSASSSALEHRDLSDQVALPNKRLKDHRFKRFAHRHQRKSSFASFRASFIIREILKTIIHVEIDDSR